ncbi:MAG: hypothetical protein ACXADW_20065 [Candidatus Hodarchaeales archaeon]|jgi:hypothetical protein
MSFGAGKNCKVTLGSDKVLGIGVASLAGVETDLLEASQFGDNWKQWEVGMKDGGELTFNGLYDPADSTGQDALRTANEDNTQVTDIRFYVNANSYWIPKTTNPASYVYVTAWEVSSDKAGMVECSFTCKISGAMELL